MIPIASVSVVLGLIGTIINVAVGNSTAAIWALAAALWAFNCWTEESTHK